MLNPFVGWERPPIRKVVCAYGVNMKTELGYHLRTAASKGTWVIDDTIFEEGGRIYSAMQNPLYEDYADRKSGKSFSSSLS